MTNPVTAGVVTVKLYFNEGRPGQQGPAGPAGAVPAERKISTGPGLSGGGDLSADRTVEVDFDDPGFGRVDVSEQPGGYTLADGDAGAVIKCTSGTPQTVTVPAGVFDVGDVIEVMQYGAGEIAVAAGSGMTLREGLKGLKVPQQYGSVSIVFLSATEAVVTGGAA